VTTPARVRPDLLEEGDFPVPFGRYTLLGLLGEGGMARVFRAELQGARGFRKRSAVKVIRAAIGEMDARLTRALIHEARLGGLLHHPNVVETYDFGMENEQAWIAMEFVEGVCLSQLLQQDEPLPPPVALEMAAQICAGLDHAHTLSVDGEPAPLVHRDLKPSNVMVANTGLLKVLDFGIAKATHIGGNTTETGLTKGTPAYMSPEQAAGQEVDARSDLFAVGCLLYEMLTGKRFFSGDTVYAIMMNVVRVEDLLKDIERLDMVEAAVPGASVVVRRCMRADRAHRYASAAELERAIRSLQGPVQAPGPIKNWVDACRAAMDPRFEPPAPKPRRGGPTQLGGGTEELSLDAEPAAAAAPSAAPHLAARGQEPLPRTRTFAPQATPPPPPVAKPADATLAPTRAVAAAEPRLGRMALAGGAVGVLLGVLGVLLWAVFLREGPAPAPAPEASPTATPAPIGDLAAAPSSAESDPPAAALRPAPPPSDPRPVGTPSRVDDRGIVAPLVPDPAPRAAAASTPPPRPAATPRATPRPASAAAAPAATLRHTPPASVVIGAPTRLTVDVDPEGACTPTLAYAPWEGGSWQTQALTDTGGGLWEAELFLPYDVAWRSGVRYQFRCERGGERVASWPASGAKKVPSLAR
jgi:serine/threonine protein kinase